MRERERKGKRNSHRLPLIRTLTRDQTCSLRMGLDLESNLQPCGVQDHAPTKLPDQGHGILIKAKPVVDLEVVRIFQMTIILCG